MTVEDPLLCACEGDPKLPFCSLLEISASVAKDVSLRELRARSEHVGPYCKQYLYKFGEEKEL